MARASSISGSKSSRETRSLANLGETASTSRVLNLAQIFMNCGLDVEYNKKPFFKDSQLNKGLLIKHTLRANERDLFTMDRRTATKIILPFDSDDLKLGGRSILVNQIGFDAFAKQFFDLSTPEGQHDIEVLRLLDTVPSLDPFLVREHLARHGFRPAPCYLKISQNDLQAMIGFANDEIKRLVMTAFGEGMEGAAAKLTNKILANNLDSDLDPLKTTFKMSEEEFAEGMFSWRGFLYFKWRQNGLVDEIRNVLRGLGTYKPMGPADIGTLEYLREARPRLGRRILTAITSAQRTLATYDQAYQALVGGSNPAPFRRFLLEGPSMFFELGENLGILSHIGSFWGYRMGPNMQNRRLNPVDYADILTDFEENLGAITIAEKAPMPDQEQAKASG